MSMSEKLCSDYKTDFDPMRYLETYYTSPGDSFFLQFVLRSLHEVFKNGHVRGHTLLDIGTGPTIHTVISACPYVQYIYLSDLCEQNREILIAWQEGKNEKGTDICDYILSMEDDNQQTSMDRFTDIRNKIKGIVPIDVRDQQILGDITVAPDIIVSSFCLEITCESVENFKQNVNKVGSLLPPGGHLIIAGVLQGTFFMVGKTRFPCCYLDKIDIHNALEAAGFGIKFWKVQEDIETEFCDCKSIFVTHSIKF